MTSKSRTRLPGSPSPVHGPHPRPQLLGGHRSRRLLSETLEPGAGAQLPSPSCSTWALVSVTKPLMQHLCPPRWPSPCSEAPVKSVPLIDRMDPAWILLLVPWVWTQPPSQWEAIGICRLPSAWKWGPPFCVRGPATDGHHPSVCWRLRLGPQPWHHLPHSDPGPSLQMGRAFENVDSRTLGQDFKPVAWIWPW